MVNNSQSDEKLIEVLVTEVCSGSSSFSNILPVCLISSSLNRNLQMQKEIAIVMQLIKHMISKEFDAFLLLRMFETQRLVRPDNPELMYINEAICPPLFWPNTLMLTSGNIVK